MPRIQTAAPDHYTPRSGTLGYALRSHSKERCRYYFFYAFFLDALIAQLSQSGQTGKPAGDFVLTKASHQIDSGHRRQDDAYNTFERDARVIDNTATAFKNMDAAHFCNLGIQPALTQMAQSLPTHTARTFYDNLCAIMGDTRPLPRSVNIGPDRIVDKLHSDLIAGHLHTQAQPLVTPARIKAYLSEAALKMASYRQLKFADGRHGLAACAECYIETYRDPAIYNALCDDVLRAIELACEQHGLDKKRFVG